MAFRARPRCPSCDVSKVRFVWTPANIALVLIEFALIFVWSPLGIEMRWKCKWCGARFDAPLVEMDD